MQHTTPVRYVWLVFAGVLLLAGLPLLAGYLLPFEQLKSIMDHLTRDGSLERFTPDLLTQLKPLLLIGALACLAAGGLVYAARHRLDGSVRGMRLAFNRDLDELGASLKSGLYNKRKLGLLAVVTLLGAVIRGLYLSLPMQHDEAYTFIAFASRPFWTAISDYSLPNNHVLHTVLVYLVYHLLGNQPWIVRLPAFLAGISLIPLTYAAGASMYKREVGLLSAGLVAASPLLIDYSANARGYTMVCAFTLCAVILAAYVKDHRNAIAWLLLALACALGFYTIPIMLYPAGMVVAWLVLSQLVGDTSDEYHIPKTFLPLEKDTSLGEARTLDSPVAPLPRNGNSSKNAFWVYLVFTCLVLAGLVVLFYTPVFISSGIAAVVNNSYVRPDDPSLSPAIGEGLLEQITSRIASTTRQWTSGVPWGFGTLAMIGFIASLALHRRICRQKIPLQAAALLWITIAIGLQRVAPLARVWMFLLPLCIIWSSAGLLGLAGLAIPAKLQVQASRATLLAAVLIPGLVLIAALPRTASLRAAPGAEEGTTLYLKDQIQPGDRVVVQSPISTPLEYYFMQYLLPDDAFDTQNHEPQKLWVVVSRRYDQTLESVMKRRGFDALIPGTPVSPVYQYKHISVYELIP